MKLRRRAGRGTLFIVAMLFAMSGALRLGSGVGVALARTGDAESASDSEVEPTLCESPSALSAALGLRADRLAVQEAALQDRLAALELVEAHHRPGKRVARDAAVESAPASGIEDEIDARGVVEAGARRVLPLRPPPFTHNG